MPLFRHVQLALSAVELTVLFKRGRKPSTSPWDGLGLHYMHSWCMGHLSSILHAGTLTPTPPLCKNIPNIAHRHPCTETLKLLNLKRSRNSPHPVSVALVIWRCFCQVAWPASLVGVLALFEFDCCYFFFSTLGAVIYGFAMYNSKQIGMKPILPSSKL